MALDKSYYVHTGRNGQLVDTTPGDMDAMFDQLAGADQVVLHFHGGLVSKSSGIALAERLKDEYAPYARPVFFVWESGAVESSVNNIDELVEGLVRIAQEKIFDRLLSVVTKWTVGKLGTEAGLRATLGHLNLPNDIDHAIEMKKKKKKTETQEEPYAEFQPEPLDEVGDVDQAERERFTEDLEQDTEFVADVEAVLAGLRFDGADGFRNARPAVVPVETRMSPDVLRDLTEDGLDPGARFVFSAAYLARRAAAVFVRVIARFVRHRDHGVYTTVVEELLRELYLANVGSVVWQIMKQETADTFTRTVGETRGGIDFLDRLARLGSRLPKRIVLVGHSTGAVFINNLLVATGKARAEGMLPPDFSYTGVIFLAPACTFSQFSHVLPRDRELPLFDNFRMFSMSDEHERANRLASIAYPRSLLYFVSGVVEFDADGIGAFDMPLVGMDRYYMRQQAHFDAYGGLGPEVAAVRQFVGARNRAIWSPTGTDSPPGFRTDSLSHGGFDDTVGPDGAATPRATIDSVLHILHSGWN